MKLLVRRQIGVYEFAELTLEDDEMYAKEDVEKNLKGFELEVENLRSGAYKPKDELPLTIIEKEAKK